MDKPGPISFDGFYGCSSRSAQFQSFTKLIEIFQQPTKSTGSAFATPEDLLPIPSRISNGRGVKTIEVYSEIPAREPLFIY